ncbi:MAG: glyoxalase [Flavobacteriaceae bacterium]
MNDRPNDLRRIRPEIKKTQQFATMRPEERFQNETLRPILKLQNPLFIAVFHQYIEKRKGVFYDLGLEKKLAYIENSLIKDQKFRNSVKGMIIGHFTVAEYQQYSLNSSSLNKRMMNMVIERLKDQVQLFDTPLSLITKVS